MSAPDYSEVVEMILQGAVQAARRDMAVRRFWSGLAKPNTVDVEYVELLDRTLVEYVTRRREVATLKSALATMTTDRDDWQASAEKYVKGSVRREPEMGKETLCFNFALDGHVVRSLGVDAALSDTFRRVAGEYRKVVSGPLSSGGSQP
jgi:hypothetical protein